MRNKHKKGLSYKNLVASGKIKVAPSKKQNVENISEKTLITINKNPSVVEYQNNHYPPEKKKIDFPGYEYVACLIDSVVSGNGWPIVANYRLVNDEIW